MRLSILKGVVELQKNSDQLAQLKKDPSLTKGTVEELLRYHTASALATRRVAKQDILLGGKVLDPASLRDLPPTNEILFLPR